MIIRGIGLISAFIISSLMLVGCDSREMPKNIYEKAVDSKLRASENTDEDRNRKTKLLLPVYNQNCILGIRTAKLNEKLKKIDVKRIEILTGSELIIVQGNLRVGRVIINVMNGQYIGATDGPIYGARVIHGTNQVWVIKQYNKIDVWDISTNTNILNPSASGFKRA